VPNNPNNEDSYAVGYRNPPDHTRFAKGQSGNPKGRPKGSQNLATLLAKAGRERINVKENGRTRSITKFEASMIQLANKAASGDLKATRELLHWSKLFAELEQIALPLHVPHEKDEAVLASMLERIRQSEDLSAEEEVKPATTDPSRDEE
jgi:hypothetical protein